MKEAKEAARIAITRKKSRQHVTMEDIVPILNDSIPPTLFPINNIFSSWPETQSSQPITMVQELHKVNYSVVSISYWLKQGDLSIISKTPSHILDNFRQLNAL